MKLCVKHKVNMSLVQRQHNCYDRFFSNYCTLFLGSFLVCCCSFLTISLDLHLHQSVLSHRLCSPTYSLFLSYSFSFYDDTSLRLGQALLGLCASSISYINCHISGNLSLTLTYSILPQIYQGHQFFTPGSLLVPVALLLWLNTPNIVTTDLVVSFFPFLSYQINL